MIKSILVPTGGSASDRFVFETALAVARLFSAHLKFVHIRVADGEALVHMPHAEFCRGQAIAQVLHDVREHSEERSRMAARHVVEFCQANQLELMAHPGATRQASADWVEETDQASARLMLHARHCDLTVVARSSQLDFMPAGLIEQLLVGTGRPVLIASSARPLMDLGTVVVGWKESREAARALSAAMPLIARARMVYLVSIEERNSADRESLSDLASQLAWHGVSAQVKVARNCASAAQGLPRTALELGADLLVTGAFGRGQLREVVFGGVTQDLVEHAELPVFMAH